MPAGLANTILEWESQWLSNLNGCLSLTPGWMNSSRMRVEFKKSYLKQDKVTFTSINGVNLLYIYELDTWTQDSNADFAVKRLFVWCF